jgi:hypothetical protein
VIVVGWFNRLGVLAMRFVPGLLLVPFFGLLFRVRDAEGNLQWPQTGPSTAPAKRQAAPKIAAGDGP